MGLIGTCVNVLVVVKKKTRRLPLKVLSTKDLDARVKQRRGDGCVELVEGVHQHLDIELVHVVEEVACRASAKWAWAKWAWAKWAWAEWAWAKWASAKWAWAKWRVRAAFGDG